MTIDEVHAKQSADERLNPPLSGQTRFKRFSFMPRSGSEIQIDQYRRGEPLNPQDRYWDAVAFRSAGGFHYPNENFDDEYYERAMKRFRRKSKTDALEQDFVDGVQHVMQEISQELTGRREVEEGRSVVARIFSRAGFRRH